MNQSGISCPNHPESTATAFCRECGKPLCAECERPAAGSVFCVDHVPAISRQVGFAAQVPVPPRPDRFVDSPYSATAPVYPAMTANAHAGPHPVLAFILGFIPGVGAICNGQYAKGLIHAVVFGLLVTIANNSHSGSAEGFAGIMISVWVFYSAFEAFHTARKRRLGIEVEEFSSLFEIKGTSKFPFGAVILIGGGAILLLDSTDVISLERFIRYWPALLIVVGVYMLYARMNPGADKQAGTEAGR
jgi:TM2 domain-containing membrane protein YozV